MAEDRRQDEATAADLKALAHPLRMRILRICLYKPLTNKEIADELDLNPATALHHVRVLAKNGFLEAQAVRTGNAGALEKPYKTTSKSIGLAIPHLDDRLSVVVAGLDAARSELLAGGGDGLIYNARLGLRLSEDDMDELTQRIQDLVAEYLKRPPAPDGQDVGFVSFLHKLA